VAGGEMVYSLVMEADLKAEKAIMKDLEVERDLKVEKAIMKDLEVERDLKVEKVMVEEVEDVKWMHMDGDPDLVLHLVQLSIW
jgi:hypothetical protein